MCMDEGCEINNIEALSTAEAEEVSDNLLESLGDISEINELNDDTRENLSELPEIPNEDSRDIELEKMLNWETEEAPEDTGYQKVKRMRRF